MVYTNEARSSSTVDEFCSHSPRTLRSRPQVGTRATLFVAVRERLFRKRAAPVLGHVLGGRSLPDVTMKINVSDITAVNIS
eukprot:4907255-Pyramimonas_sp.AAC.1